MVGSSIKTDPETDDIVELFKSHGLRCTSQRRAIYEALGACTTHPTADQLFYEVGGKSSGMSLATVYNTLEAFCEAGMAHKRPGQSGSARYDACVHNHLHTRCVRTGAVHDVPDDLGQEFLKRLPRYALEQIEAALGFKVHHVQIDLVGEYTG